MWVPHTPFQRLPPFNGWIPKKVVEYFLTEIHMSCQCAISVQNKMYIIIYISLQAAKLSIDTKNDDLAKVTPVNYW